jgi:hypothetical protein
MPFPSFLARDIRTGVWSGPESSLPHGSWWEMPLTIVARLERLGGDRGYSRRRTPINANNSLNSLSALIGGYDLFMSHKESVADTRW